MSGAAPGSASANAAVHGRLLGMALLWGLSWPAGRVVAQAMPPLTASAWRFLVAAVLLLAWLWWRDRAWPRWTLKQWLGIAAAGAVGVFGYAVFFLFALRQVEASRAAVVVTTNPVFTTLLAAWLFKEVFNARIALGLALAVLGSSIVLTNGAPWQLFTGALGLGEWLLIGCIATWVAYSLMGKRLMAGIDPLAATAFTAAVGCVLLWAAALSLDGPAVVQGALQGLDGRGWVAMGVLSVGSTVLAYAWFYEGIARLGAGVASSYISLVPVFGVLSAVLALGEPLGMSLLVGGALALAGIVIANRAR